MNDPFKWLPTSAADISSHLGLVCGVIGFVIAIIQIRKARSAADSAAQAAEEAKNKIGAFDSLQDLTEVQSLIHQIKASVVSDIAPSLLAERCEKTRRLLIRLRAKFEPQEGSQPVFQSTIVVLKQLEDRLMVPGKVDDAPFEPSSHYSDLNDHFDKITEFLARLRSSL